MIPKGTRVRIQTTNGGDTIATLAENYRPSDCTVALAYPGRPEAVWRVWFERVKSIEAVPHSGSGTNGPCTAQ